MLMCVSSLSQQQQHKKIEKKIDSIDNQNTRSHKMKQHGQTKKNCENLKNDEESCYDDDDRTYISKKWCQV